MAFTFVRRVTGDLPVIIAIWSGGKRAFGKIRSISDESESLNRTDFGHNDNAENMVTSNVLYTPPSGQTDRLKVKGP
jgi:hypothetical protein